MINPFADTRSLKDIAAVAGYGILVALAIVFVWAFLSDLHDKRAAVSASRAMLAQIDSRTLTQKQAASPFKDAPPGSPFLQGETLNVAAAGLLQQVATAVRKIGGNVLSSQVDLEGTRAKDGWVSLVLNGELDQNGLQRLLYEVESGMPFLFIDQLTVQPAPNSADGRRMRVLLAVSGRWWDGR